MGLLHDVLGSYQTALWCLAALEGVAAVSVPGGRGVRDDP
jgi:cyanate permease